MSTSLTLLRSILGEAGRDVAERTLVFVETKRQADFLCLNLCEEGFPATSIHGDRLQSEREQVVPPTSTAAGAEGVQVGPAADPGGHGGGGQGPRH